LNKISDPPPLKIIGDYDQIKNYKQILFDLSAKLINVDFVGLLMDKRELLEIISKSCLFIYPSIIESMSMMMLEVASLKTPMICSDIRENRDVFNDSEVLFSSPNNVNDLVTKINWALKHPEEMEQKATNALSLVLRNHDWELIANKYGEIYKQLIKS